tara:strand:- start:3421 stop:4077 length:657 start_codon:yes stop_codon:yes gene_type:complete
MYDFFETILSPLIFVIESFFFFLDSNFNSPILSIVFTSISISLILLPLLRLSKRYEDKVEVKISFIDGKLKDIPNKLSGEDRFRAIEKVYDEFDFHPIQNVLRGLSFYVVLPILMGAYLFFRKNIDAFDIEVLGLINLSKPDNLIFGINLLPFFIFFINYLDSIFRGSTLSSGKNTYLIISFFICLLIYSMPSCMTLYWLTSCIFSFIFNFFYRKKEG